MNLESFVGYFADVEKRFDQTRGVQLQIARQAAKNKKQIKGLRGAVLCLSGAVIILALQLAERKRCENYLQSQIDKLAGKDNEEEATENEDDNGGAVDA